MNKREGLLNFWGVCESSLPSFVRAKR